MACRVKTNTTWQQKTQIPILAKVKTNTLQGHKRYIKTFEFEINNLRIQIFAPKLT